MSGRKKNSEQRRMNGRERTMKEERPEKNNKERQGNMPQTKMTNFNV
ncbi:hypothetical protein [Anaerorudis cellulosivorans]|nr:hypothetical protein [Seramator thermalis]MCW1734224.1 hypothetical protein [Seramator thermalis]